MAEVIFADPVTEDILLNDDGEVAGGEEAECACCCDCETDGPTANFEHVQSSADPDGNACCVEFTNYSEAGTCGGIVESLWDFGDENTSEEIHPTHCYTGSGPWTVRLTVTDSAGCTDFMETSVGCPCNCAVDAPEADFSYEQTDDDPCCFDFFDESAFNLDCGNIVEWLWDFGDGDTSTEESPSHCYEGVGPWDVTLTVTDALGCTDSVVGEVECCNCSTDGPEADFTFSQTNDDPCCFAFTNTSTPGACGAIVSYAWDFGDGNSSTEANPTHCYSGEGPWDVTLTVTDASGCFDIVEYEVICGEEHECCDGFFSPPSVTVILPNPTAPQDICYCNPLPGSHTLNRRGDDPCVYEKVFTCDVGETTYTMTISANIAVPSVGFVQFPGGVGNQPQWVGDLEDACTSGSHSLDRVMGAPMLFYCGYGYATGPCTLIV